MCLNMMYVQLLDEQTQKDFLSILFNSGSDFCHLRFESFSQNVKKNVVEKFCLWPFHDSFNEWIQVVRSF